MTDEEEKRTCRVIVIGLARPRVAKVMAVLQEMQQTDHDEETAAVLVEYLPCVASFDSYEDEHGKNIRYLISVNYHGPNGAEKTGSSLAPFFDQDEEKKNADKKEKNARRKKNLGIIGVSIGAGIEEEEDVERIRAFFETLRGAEKDPLPIELIKPNPEFATMAEEMEAFKALDSEAKAEAIHQYTLGPGKMAKFASDFSKRIIREILEKEETDAKLAKMPAGDQTTAQNEIPARIAAPRAINPDETRYACRKCRTILFGEDDIEDPPHVPAQHQFSARKMHHGGAGPSSCQSFFLTDKGLDWMGDMSGMEGRFNCPKCKSKLGTWHWAGAQCSCGSWVTPAVQIPKSKVDVLSPNTGHSLPVGTIISPLITQLQ
jgi:dual specificity phosphatase 12